MINISIKETARLKNCSEQFLRKQALNGQIETTVTQTKSGKKNIWYRLRR